MTNSKKGKINKQLSNSLMFWTMIIARYLKIPSSVFPKKMAFMMEHWTLPMMLLYAQSGGTRYYMDQPCELSNPSSFEPKAEVESAYKLSEQDVQNFYENGFIGPFTAISEEEMALFGRQLEQELSRDSKAFGFNTVRDRHLDNPALFQLFAQPAIKERLAQLLGADLLIWRSQVFNQEPGAPPITWHQASTYMLEDYKRPILAPENINELFQLTTWIAVDEATIENGCLQFIPGTHRNIKTVKVGGNSGFYAAHFEMEFEVDPSKVVSMELKPGQFVIFSERVIHGSPGNRSQKRRMGINFRTIKTSTKVYQGQDSHYAMHLKEKYDLSNWGVMVLRGEDTHQLNKTIEPPLSKQSVVS